MYGKFSTACKKKFAVLKNLEQLFHLRFIVLKNLELCFEVE